MRGATIRLFCLSCTILSFASCRAPANHPDTTSPPLAAVPHQARPLEKDTGPILPMHATKKGPIIVGGCKESCEDPKNAFRNFSRALFDVGGNELPAWRSFMDTTTLVHNGEELGARWADMWVMKRFDERAAEVDSWLTAYRKRVGTVSDRQAVEDSLASGLRFRRISSHKVEFIFIAPDRESAENAGEWRILLGRRGLEWLVQAIYD